MPSTQVIPVTSTRAFEATGADGASVTVQNLGPDSCYYATAATVSSGSNDGTLASGASLAFTPSKYFISAGSSRLQVTTRGLTDRVDGLAASAGFVAPLEDPRVQAVTNIGNNFRVQGCRVICRRTGMLMGLYYWAGAVITGTVRGAVYDVGVSASTVRTKIYDGGIVTPPGVSRWVLLGDPNIAVVAGQHLDFALQLDTAAAEYGRGASPSVSAQFTMPGTPLVIGGCVYKLNWTCTTPIDLTTPATIAEAAAAVSASPPMLIAQII